MPTLTTAQIRVTGMVCIGICVLAGTRLVRNLLIHYRDTAVIKEPRPKTQYITQETEDTLSPSTLKKLISSTTYSIREIASRIVCDRALHDEGTIESLLWHITRSDHDTREKGLRALYMLATKSGMPELNQRRVYSAIVKSLSFCVTDVEHEPYDKEFDSWDFRDINERLCLMLVHRLTIEFGIREFIKCGFVSRWLAKEPWGNTEQERYENITNCYHQSNLLSYIMLQATTDALGREEMKKVKLIGDDPNQLYQTASDLIANGENIGGEDFLSSYDILPSIEGGAPRAERSVEEQRLRRLHRDAMVLHDNSQPFGIDSIITRDGGNIIDGISRDELTMEADRQLRTQGLLTALTPLRLENMREILRNESHRMEQAGLEEEPSVGILRDILENEIHNRIGSVGIAALVEQSEIQAIQDENSSEE